MSEGLKILAFGAHPADVFISACGTLLKHVEKGDEVTVVTLTYGERSHAKAMLKSGRKYSLKEIRKIKETEFKNAAKELGAKKAVIMGLDECPLEANKETLSVIMNLIEETRPDIILTSWIYDWLNPDHEITGRIVTAACMYVNALAIDESYKATNIYYYIVNPLYLAPELNFVPDVYVDISSTIESKINILSNFDSQGFTKRFLENYFRSVHFFVGQRCGVTYAEAFKRIWRPPKSCEYLL